MRKTFVIVGAGFSGTVLAANLLRNPPREGAEVVLIERSDSMGRGVAYAVHDHPYLLNVPAIRLSADSRDPLRFLRFAKSRLSTVTGSDFLPRALYGDYLQDLLLQSERGARPDTRLQRVFGEVTALVRVGNSRRLAARVAGREPIAADVVVLAFGSPTAPLPSWAQGVAGHPAFRHNPRDLPDTLSAEHSVLIVGNGLTMADAASSLSRHPERLPTLHTISRRGLTPRTQTHFQAGAMRGDGEALLSKAHSLRQLLSACRALAREVETLGGDWRELIAYIRHLAPALWRRMPHSERRRFVRHLQVHWDVHRHRLPPQLAERMEALNRSGKLRIGAGRIEAIVPEDQRLRVSWRPRGAKTTAEMTVDMIVNATGPNYNIERSDDALIRSLQAAGLVVPDRLNLGIRTAQFGACVDAQGGVNEHLYYLGPMLRAEHLDATAAAELSVHAEQLAAHLAAATALHPGETL
jgi:uncharacterized NAD(P)/FAD-binding protein YdhS